MAGAEPADLVDGVLDALFALDEAAGLGDQDLDEQMVGVFGDEGGGHGSRKPGKPKVQVIFFIKSYGKYIPVRSNPMSLEYINNYLTNPKN